ncbi:MULTISPECIES: DUF1178 family protein [Simplicispira]|jgi:hypothetical protein|uniref:DUF1178 family protein n=1 Tax=Simplicispira metamorpha TaxID=80881 RepID=A0A4R2NFL8_9BURK|nr:MULTISPECIES: DUF1178 family protein [Simplicispira]MBP7412754.1 DUF1178 family protein [Giesbergeria sp.]MDD2690385.1 DUF1178 family protein [Simplicispira sp.]TCP20067.1 hypothetical protein EV674_10235 [Simplicispira metamorpha]
MKVLDLCCQNDHTFEGWFGSEADFQDQHQRGLLQCPLCGDSQVRKVLSAPRIQRSARTVSAQEPVLPAASTPLPASAAGGADHSVASLQAAWLEVARKIVAQTEDVGAHFADEARRMHHGEVPERAIRGQASREETVQLLDEGIAVLPLPGIATKTLH